MLPEDGAELPSRLGVCGGRRGSRSSALAGGGGGRLRARRTVSHAPLTAHLLFAVRVIPGRRGGAVLVRGPLEWGEDPGVCGGQGGPPLQSVLSLRGRAPSLRGVFKRVGYLCSGAHAGVRVRVLWTWDVPRCTCRVACKAVVYLFTEFSTL